MRRLIDRLESVDAATTDEAANALRKCMEDAKQIMVQVKVTRDTMKTMALDDGQIGTLNALTSHIIDRCTSIIEATNK